MHRFRVFLSGLRGTIIEALPTNEDILRNIIIHDLFRIH